METTLCILGGLATMAVAIGLAFLRSPDWHNDSWTETAKSRSLLWWCKFQMGVRRWTNILLGLIGASVLACGIIPHGRIWMAMWLTIFVALLAVLFLAALDACLSMFGYRQAVPETARQTLSRCEPHP